MRYLSLFSGIEAASVAWEKLGWIPVGFAEVDGFPSAVLQQRYPNVPNLGDVKRITSFQIERLGPIDIVVGGSPCQDLSIAGKRAGLKNFNGTATRSGLFDEQIRIFEIAREKCGARFMLWENVPGAFSSNGGSDFAYVLGSMVGRSLLAPEQGWKNSGVCLSDDGKRCVEWRVFDAQYFRIPQRRRRIFALLDTGDWWSRQPILFEPESLQGDTQKSRGKREGVASRIDACFTPSGFGGYSQHVGTLRSTGGDVGPGSENIIIYENHANDSRVRRCEKNLAPTLHSRMGTGGGNVPLVMSSGQANAEIARDHCPTLNCLHEAPIVMGKSVE